MECGFSTLVATKGFSLCPRLSYFWQAHHKRTRITKENRLYNAYQGPGQGKSTLYMELEVQY